MKAYRLSISGDDDAGGAIVFAQTGREAKKQVFFTDLADPLQGEWTYLRVHRDKRYDGMEGLTPAELAKHQWRDGWQWFDMNYPDPDEATDEEFLTWHNSTFGNSA